MNAVNEYIWWATLVLLLFIVLHFIERKHFNYLGGKGFAQFWNSENVL